MTHTTAKALAAVFEIIVEAVKESDPHGIPGGSLYAALTKLIGQSN